MSNKKQTENVKSILEGIKNFHELEDEIKNEVIKETPPPIPTIDEEELKEYDKNIAENGEIIRQ